MDAYIGKLLSDGQVKYICVSYYGHFQVTGMCLKNFYNKEKRVNDLLALGGLAQIGPTPYGKKRGDEDKIHCDAYMRDNGCKSKEYRSATCSKETYLTLGECLYLFQEGRWYMLNENRMTDISDTCFYHYAVQAKPSDLYGLTVKVIDKDGFHNYHSGDVGTWKALKEKATEEKLSFFVFRNDRLVSIVNPGHN